MGLKWAQPSQDALLFRQETIPPFRSIHPPDQELGLETQNQVHILHKLKNRIINFRVTDDELALLKNASNLHGARCLSEFARAVMLGTAAGSTPGGDLNGDVVEKIQSLDCRLTAAETDLSRVIDMLWPAGEVCGKT